MKKRTKVKHFLDAQTFIYIMRTHAHVHAYDRARTHTHTHTHTQVKRIVKLVGFVHSDAEFYEQPAAINGASDLMVEVSQEVC